MDVVSARASTRTSPRVADVLAALPPEVDAVAVRDGDSTIVAACPLRTVSGSGSEALRLLDALEPGWWAGWVSYDLGRAIEDTGDRLPPEPIPDVRLALFEARAVLEPGRPPRVQGEGPGREALGSALASPRAPGRLAPLRNWTSNLDRPAYTDRVGRILEHLAAGDCYQVNLTRRMTCPGVPDPVALHAALSAANPAPHAAFVRMGDVTVVSASPESFLRSDGTTVTTRPVKGTGTDPEALAASPKDRAENVMIVDLSRNDLGRVCDYGTVRVPHLCAIEAHPGLYHLVSTVSGKLREGVGLGEVVRATFPPASVTGCPKPRVLRVIETLETVRRGVYCGAVGWVDTARGTMDLNVAIRTFTITGGSTTFGVGAGIVADSDPGAEWEETQLKAARLIAVASGQTSR